MEQLGAEGDLELLRLVAEQRQRQEEGDATNTLSDEQIGLIEGSPASRPSIRMAAAPRELDVIRF